MMGAMASLLAVMSLAPAPGSLAVQAAVTGAMANIATWVFMPSLALTLMSGLLAMGATPGYHDAGWVWAKAATGLLMFEGGLAYVLGPVQSVAKDAASALAGQLDPAAVARLPGAERTTLWLLLVVALANVALGVWRPKLEMPIF